MTLIKKRGGHRAQVAKLMKQAEDNLSSSPLPVVHLHSILAEIQRQKSIIVNLDDDILDSLEDETLINKEIEESSNFNLEVHTIIRKLNNNLDRASHDISHGGNFARTVKLPDIKLMKFTGDTLQWQKFWDLFRSSIHDRRDLSGATKFHYLISQLSGEAEQLLAGFDHTDLEYTEAVKLLQETYGKPQRIIQARLHALFDLKPPQANATDLSKFRSLFEGHLRGLKSLGADVDAAGYVFSELLIRKLPSKVRDNLNRSQKSDFWTLADLRREIDVEIGHLQSVELDQNNNHDDNCMPTAVFKTSVKSNLKCNLCFESHLAYNCTKYSSVDSKRKRVNELHLCFNCMKGKHQAKFCTNNGRCKSCNARHHTSLCNKHSSNSSSSVSARLPNSNFKDNSVTSLNINGDQSSTTILPTALLSLTYGGTVSDVRTIFDSGSQKILF